MLNWRPFVGYLALVLGVLGSAIAVAIALAAIWLGATATDVVEDAVFSIDAAVDRVDARLAETELAVNQASTAGELRARAQSVADLVRNARESLGTIDDHLLYGRLPVDTAPLSALLDRLEESSDGVNDDLAGVAGDEPLSEQVKVRITDRFAAAQDVLAAASDRIQDLGDQLRLWVRLSAFVGLLLCLWGLWAQIALTRRGWKTRTPRRAA